MWSTKWLAQVTKLVPWVQFWNTHTHLRGGRTKWLAQVT